MPQGICRFFWYNVVVYLAIYYIHVYKSRLLGVLGGEGVLN
jgi:hypothetical protein